MNKKESMYNICYQYLDDFERIPIKAPSAQEAVNIVREINPEYEVIEVAKVLENWE